MSAPTVDQLRKAIGAYANAMEHEGMDGIYGEASGPYAALNEALGVLSEELDRLRLDAQRWNAVRTALKIMERAGYWWLESPMDTVYPNEGLGPITVDEAADRLVSAGVPDSGAGEKE